MKILGLCAWIMWVSAPASPPHEATSFFPSAGYESRQECEREAIAKRQGRAVILCLPDPVDPRGPQRWR
jgi:hypothetical protein